LCSARGKSLNAFQFTDHNCQLSDYADLSVLSSHLIKDPVDLAIRRGTSTDETDTLYVVNGQDGSMLQFTRSWPAKASSRRLNSQPASMRATSSLPSRPRLITVYVIVKRTINATTKYYLEQFDRDALMDSSLYATVGSATSSVAVDHLPNTQIWVRADGLVQAQRTVPATAPFTVSIDPAANEDYEVGIDISRRDQDYAARAQPADRQLFGCAEADHAGRCVGQRQPTHERQRLSDFVSDHWHCGVQQSDPRVHRTQDDPRAFGLY
jgi:hypothetical protein